MSSDGRAGIAIAAASRGSTGRGARWFERVALAGFLAIAASFGLDGAGTGVLARPLGTSLDCPGTPAPVLPGPGWQANPAWDWRTFQDFLVLHPEQEHGPVAIALDRDCNVYVADSSGNAIEKFQRDGTLLANFPLTPRDLSVDGPQGLALDSAGNIYVADSSQYVVRKLDPNGQEVATWGTCRTCDPTLPGQFVSPDSIAIDAADYVYVLDEALDRVQRIGTDGTVQAGWGSNGSEPGQFSVPSAIAVDLAGNVYVADKGNHRVQKLTPDGAVLNVWGSQGKGPDHFDWPAGIAVDGAGNVYVSDANNWRVVELSPDGVQIQQWPACPADDDCSVLSGSESGQFFSHRGLAVDGQGSIYVADTGNSRVQEFIVVDWELVPPPEDDSGG
jgi:tripartite motif-containing protein 71